MHAISQMRWVTPAMAKGEAALRHRFYLHARRLRRSRRGAAAEIQLINVGKVARALRRTYGCGSRYIGCVHVREGRGTNAVSNGIVDIFELLNCAEAERCYAWTEEADGQRQLTIVLHSFLVTSPESAVRNSVGWVE